MASEKKQEQFLVVAAVAVIAFLFWRKYKAGQSSKTLSETPGGVSVNSGRSSGNLVFNTAQAEEVQLRPFITADTVSNNC